MEHQIKIYIHFSQKNYKLGQKDIEKKLHLKPILVVSKNKSTPQTLID